MTYNFIHIPPTMTDMRLIFVILTLIFLGNILQAQKVLSLENPKKYKRIAFAQGDFIRFRTHGEKRDYNGTIESISDSIVVVVKNVHVPGESEEMIRTVKEFIQIKDISLIYYAPKTYARGLRTGYYRSTIATGSILITATSIRTLTTGETPSRQEILLATGILTTGLLARFLGKDVYKIGNKWQLKSMDGFYLTPKGKMKR